MKTQLYFSVKTLTAFIFFYGISLSAFSQNTSGETGGQYPCGRNDASNPCITPEQYKEMEKQMTDNSRMLGLPYGKINPAMTTTFSWPLRMANGLNDCSYYVIANYLDQDTTAGIKDWNCGTVTYDGHRGNDITIIPYPFYKMDNNEVEVIAAAPGTIVNKVDGNFDKNCAPNNLAPNYIAIEHADGSVAIYYHMKMNSLTSKVVGQTVVTGEYLGVVGSSGNSTGPHLHFEVWGTTLSSSLKDAYSGPCNSLNANSWWVNQKPYTEPNIVKAQVGSILPVLPACPATETPNEDSCLMAPGSGKFIIYIRNETIGLIASMRIVNPNGTTFTSWTHNSNNNYFASYYIFTRTLPTTAGTYTFEAVYNGDTCRKAFGVNCPVLGVQTITLQNEILVAPNPANNSFNLTGDGIDNGNYRFVLTNLMGQVVLSDNMKIENNMIQKTVSISELPDGIYFLTIETDKMRIVRKIVKRN